MRRRILIPVGVVAVLVAVALVWWLKSSSDERAKTAKTASGVSTPGARAKSRAPAKPATVSGRVMRKSDGAGVQGAIVSLVKAELGAEMGSVNAPTLIATTDANGAWIAKEVPPADYVIAATARGLLPGAKAKLTVASGEQKSGVDFALEAGGTAVKGTVTDMLAGPIESARITAKRQDWSLSADAQFVTLTDDKGEYELTLPDDHYGVSAEHDEYTRDTESIEVAGKPLTVDFKLIPGSVIRGQVVARDTGKPVPGALVKGDAGRRSFRSRDSTAIADADGNFTLRALSSGAVSITARGRGYASAQPTRVQIGIGEQIEGIQVLVDGAFSITGRVVKKGTKDGISGVRVGAFSMGGGEAEALEPSDPDGYFEIAGVKAGSYMMFAGVEGMMLEIGKPTVTVEDKDVKDVIIELATGATLSGRVDPPGVATVMLELEGEVGIANMFEMIKAALAKTESDASGAFAMKSAPPGKFKLAAMTKDGKLGKLPITVTDVDQSGLVIKLEQKASISGRVIDTNGKPVADTTVVADPEEDRPRMFSMSMMRDSVNSKPDGTFKVVGLEAGKYDVRARSFDDMESFMPGKDRKKNIVEVAAGAEKTGVTVTVEARDGVIRGRVVGPDGKTAPDAWVTASRERDPLKLKGMVIKAGDGGGGDDDDKEEMMERFSWWDASEPVLTNDKGEFTIVKLKKGKYTVVAEGPRGSSRGEKGGVKTGDTTTIQLAALGTLIVSVTQKNAPVTSYDVSCTSKAGEIERHSSAADGVFRLDSLAPGDYKCRVRSSAGTAEGKATVTTGETKLALQVKAWASVTGTVVSILDGKPVPGISVTTATGDDPEGWMATLAGKGIKTDANGRFVLERVSAGKGRIMLIGADIMSGGNMETHSYEAKEGERVDVGQIKVVPPRSGEAGTLGMATDIDGDTLKVTSVKEGGPAALAGVQVDDKITAIEGQPIKQLTPITAQKLVSSGNVGVGQTVKVTLARGPTVPLTAVKW